MTTSYTNHMERQRLLPRRSGGGSLTVLALSSVNKLTGPHRGRMKRAAVQVDGGDLDK